jgi:hypothetical protein
MTFHEQLVQLVGPDAAQNIRSITELISTYGYIWVVKNAHQLLH